MRNKILTVGILACFASAPALAADTGSTEESFGVGAGAVVGAVAGGPVGAILGAAAGAMLGDAFHERNEEIDELTVDLKDSRERAGRLETRVVALTSSIETLDADLERMRALARPEILALLEAGIEMDLLFRTDEDVLKGSSEERLRQLATSLATMPDVQVRLDGYADERGDETYNRELSERRAAYVRELLVAGGVPAERIRLHAHGESPAADASVDSYALERKVSLTLFVDDSRSYASAPAGDHSPR